MFAQAYGLKDRTCQIINENNPSYSLALGIPCKFSSMSLSISSCFCPTAEGDLFIIADDDNLFPHIEHRKRQDIGLAGFVNNDNSKMIGPGIKVFHDPAQRINQTGTAL